MIRAPAAGPVGVAIRSGVTGSTGAVTPVDFNITGNDPITGEPVPAYATVSIGASPVLLFVNKNNTDLGGFGYVDEFGTPHFTNVNRLAESKRVPEAERPLYLTAEFQHKLAPFDPRVWLPGLKSTPVRLRLIAADAVTPAACLDRLAAAAPASAQVVRYKDNQALHAENSGGRIFDWIKAQLGKITGPYVD